MTAQEAKRLAEENKEKYLEQRFKARVQYIDELIYRTAYSGQRIAGISFSTDDKLLYGMLIDYYRNLGYSVTKETNSLIISWDSNEPSISQKENIDKSVIPPDNSITIPPPLNSVQPKLKWWEKLMK